MFETADILLENRLKGAEFENYYYELLEEKFQNTGLLLEKQFNITPYWRLDCLFGTEKAVDYLKSTDSAEKIRACPHYWGYIENKNMENRVNAGIARKQLLINYVLKPCHSAIVQKNNGQEPTHEELFRQSGCVIYDASTEGIDALVSTINSRNRHTKVRMEDSRRIFNQNKNELIERIIYLSGFNDSKNRKISYNVPVIVYKTEKDELDAPTLSEILGMGILFNSTVRLFYGGELLSTAKTLANEANDYFMKTNGKNIITPEESSDELDILLLKHYPSNVYAKNVKVSWHGFDTMCQSAALL